MAKSTTTRTLDPHHACVVEVGTVRTGGPCTGRWELGTERGYHRSFVRIRTYKFYTLRCTFKMLPAVHSDMFPDIRNVSTRIDCMHYI